MKYILEGIKLIGGLAGLLSLGWKIIEEFNTYLKIKVEASNDNDSYSIYTEIENVNKIIDKKISNAFIIVSPENLKLFSAGQLIANQLKIGLKVYSTTQFEYIKSNGPVYIDKQVAFIPLSFYYDENIRIGDEKLTYRCTLDNNQLDKGNYSVRFFIYGENRLHRATQDLISIK